MERFGALYVGVNTAGGGIAMRTVGKDGPHSLDEFRKTIELNLIGSFDFLRLCAERMARNQPNADGERGVVISTASIHSDLIAPSGPCGGGRMSHPATEALGEWP